MSTTDMRLIVAQAKEGFASLPWIVNSGQEGADGFEFFITLLILESAYAKKIIRYQDIAMPAQTIDHVIQKLEDIVDWSKRHESRLGYFAALYRKVTISVKKGIANGFFEDGERLERLDVVFANRYIMAFEQHRSNQKTTRSWQLAFETSKHWWPIVLQHLLMGMNAHINLDLGIAAARTSPGDTLPSLKNDFDKINEILAALVDGVQQELARIWPLLGLLDRIGGRTDEA